MLDFIPLTPGDTNYTLNVTLDDELFKFTVRWNSTDLAFYLDIKTENDTVIAEGVKCVLGVNLGRLRTHEFFKKHIIRLYDSSGDGRDAAFDDMGDRVQMLHITVGGVVALGSGITL